MDVICNTLLKITSMAMNSNFSIDRSNPLAFATTEVSVSIWIISSSMQITAGYVAKVSSITL
jgi:hypothetical protein